MSLCLCMIVKNESHVIRRCLRSVKPFIDSYSISDTGSTDNTMDIIREELAGLPGVLRSDPWQGFGPSRNVARSRAKGDYILSIDADEELEHLSGSLELDPKIDYFLLKQVHEDMIFWVTRITRNDPSIEWKDKVHNFLEIDPSAKGIQLKNFQIRPYFDSYQNIAGNKFLGHLAHYETAPRTSRNVFYHAQTLDALQRSEEAIQIYRERAEMGGWEEEVYYSLKKIGDHLRALNRPIEQVIAAYLRAYSYRPTRYEALVDLCELYGQNGRWTECYALSLVKAEPSNDILFVDYRCPWRLLEQHALAAYYLGKKEEARSYFLRVAEFDLSPFDRQRTEKNLTYCETPRLKAYA